MYVHTLNAIKTSGFRIDRSLLVLVNDDSWIRKLRRLGGHDAMFVKRITRLTVMYPGAPGRNRNLPPLAAMADGA